jgi:predicted transcriptional regulator
VRRNDLDICADLLKVTMNGAKKTQMVYKANLNFNIVKKYIKRLSDNGLIQFENGHFFTTDKGSTFLARYREFVEPLSVLWGNEL